MNRPLPLSIKGFQVFKSYLNRRQQELLVQDLRRIVEAAPLVRPLTPGRKQMSVRMTAAGELGWITDRKGYRYARTHPQGSGWPEIPQPILSLWSELTNLARMPDCCLINYYGEGSKMGVHQDKDEGDFAYPVLSVSLGDDALFRMGNPTRGGSTESIWLSSGDIVLMGGSARLAYHGIDRIRFQSSSLLANGGRLNITLRVVDSTVSQTS